MILGHDRISGLTSTCDSRKSSRHRIFWRVSGHLTAPETQPSETPISHPCDREERSDNEMAILRTWIDMCSIRHGL